MILHTVWEATKMVFMVALVLLLLVEFIPMKTAKRDSPTQEVLHLANMIRWITEDKLTENKVLKYAGFIYQASKRYEVNCHYHG